jgi:dTDP-4-amino-4,6-dideoxygalactose transaminase
MLKMKVPFLDLSVQYQQIKNEINTRLREVLDNNTYVLGRFLQQFEVNFARYQNLKYTIGTGSGTSALMISLLAIKNIYGKKWGKGKWEVICPCNTFIATAEAIVQAGFEPRFVDIDEQTYNLDVEQLKKVIIKKTKIIIPVHLYGQPAEMDAIMKVAGEKDLLVVEDCAQAHGAEYLIHSTTVADVKGQWKKLGGFGVATGFSFYPAKNLGAYGDAGAVGTNDPAIAEFVRMYRDHGSMVKYEHRFIGSTDRLDSLQAVILDVKLKYLDEWNSKRRHHADLYNQYFKDVTEVRTPLVPDWARPVWHLYVIRVRDREGLQKYLQDHGIGSGFHYKKPLHLQLAFAYLGYKKGDFPATEKVMSEIISLPIYAELQKEQIKYVVEKVKEFVSIKK